jgi:hypothetical protein
MTAGIVDTLLLLAAVFLASLRGNAFGFAPVGISSGPVHWDDGRPTRFGFASFAALVSSLGAATLLAMAFKWWVPVAVLFLGPVAAFAVARRGGKMPFTRAGKFWWIAGFFLLATVAAHAAYRLWVNPDVGGEI